jgi:hypothetical protein
VPRTGSTWRGGLNEAYISVGGLRMPKCEGSAPGAIPACIWVRGVAKAQRGSWQDTQAWPGGLDSEVSKKISRPRSASATPLAVLAPGKPGAWLDGPNGRDSVAGSREHPATTARKSSSGTRRRLARAKRVDMDYILEVCAGSASGTGGVGKRGGPAVQNSRPDTNTSRPQHLTLNKGPHFIAAVRALDDIRLAGFSRNR